MKRGIVVLGLVLGVISLANIGLVEPAQARCCDRVTDGCNEGSDTGCAMANPENLFFPDPCECEQGECIDPTQNDGPCGGTPGGECGDGNIDGGEDCDDGAANGTFMSCCALDCSYKSDGAICDDGTFCDGFGECDGAGTCDPNETDPPCPEGIVCDEENRSCNEAQTPVASTQVLVVLAALMVLGATFVLRRRRRGQSF
jgi:hypothetical protein